MKSRSAYLRFIEKVIDPGNTTDCWLWTGATIGGGYGSILTHKRSAGGRMQVAHRWAYEFAFGEIPKGLELDHLCRVRHCVNPWHLEPVTPAENVRRGEAGKWQADKTHCPQGHPYSETNTWRHGQTQARRCRICVLESNRKGRA